MIPSIPSIEKTRSLEKMSVLQKVRRFVWGDIPESRAERRLLLKIDWFILSYCCLMVRILRLSINVRRPVAEPPIDLHTVFHELCVSLRSLVACARS